MQENITADIVRAVEDKLDSSYDWKKPRIVAVKVPEEIEWESFVGTEKVQKKVKHWFDIGRLKQVGLLYIMGKKKYRRSDSFAGFSIVVDPEQKLRQMVNPKAAYPIPAFILDTVLKKQW